MKQWIVLSAGLALTLGVVSAPDAQLIDDRLSLIPTKVAAGTGTVRLDGMGGFKAVVPDENFELNLLDFSSNPAGFSDDRDAWSVDIRYSHKEQTDRSNLTNEDDVRINDGTLLVAYHNPGKFGLGGQLDYAEVQVRDVTRTENDFRLAGFGLSLNKYFFEKLSIGLRVSQSEENEDVFSSRVYNISHDGKVNRGGLGVGMEILPGVTLGARGDVFSFQVDGESRGPFHTDQFDWSRPNWLGSVHGFVHRGRLHGGVDYTRQELEGEEEVQISWSRRFIFNPTDEAVADNFRTITEDRTNTEFRTRWRFEVIPNQVAVGVSVFSGEDDLTVLANPNALGSLEPGTVSSNRNVFVGGGSWTGLHQRLLVAAELELGTVKLDDENLGVLVQTNRDDTIIRVGGEYLLGETFVGRAGLTRSDQEFVFTESPEASGSYASTSVAVGLGLVPGGGIWQFDIAYDVVVDSDLNGDRSRFSGYLKYLF